MVLKIWANLVPDVHAMIIMYTDWKKSDVTRGM